MITHTLKCMYYYLLIFDLNNLVNLKFLKEMVDPKFSMSLDDDCFYVNNADYCTTEKVHFDYSPSLYLYISEPLLG